MAQQVDVDIRVKGIDISPFSALTINQQFNGHHYFELRFNHDVIEDEHAVLINKSKDYLGELITVKFSTKYDSGYPDSVFSGIITEVAISNNVNAHGDLIFKGYSPTILMEGGEHNASFLDKNLSQILNTAIKGIPGNLLSTAVAPAYKSSIPYVVQYKESNFDFTRRLAAQYGEWFFYDGSKFNFGKPSGGATIDLNYPQHVSNLNLQVKLAPLNFERTGYYSKEDQSFSSTSASQSVAGLDNFGNLAQSTSNRMFQKPVTGLSYGPVQDKGNLDDQVTVQKSAQASRMVYVHAWTDVPYIKLGSTVAISADRTDSGQEDFGKFTVTSIIHSTDGLGNYSNIIEGIPSSLAIVPNPYSAKPVCESQLGIVKSVKDPDNLGKVQVQLMWQKDNDTTPFVRVMMPHAGTRNGDKKNRGAFFTPEEGDYVIMGFTQNDPDRPFVMGSVPHGKAINTSMNSDNNAKAIRTRSGNTIYFYDKEKSQEQEIRIETDTNNYISILLKNGKGGIQIFTNDTIEVQSTTSVSVTSKDITIKASNDVTIQASNNINLQANKNISIKAQNVSTEASQNFGAKGMQVDIEGSGGTTVKDGAQLTLNGGGMTTIKGGLVQIN